MSRSGARVAAVALDARHRFSKQTAAQVTLLAGLGVEGDAHCGATVRHRSRVRFDPSQPNLRQVHLVASEHLDALRAQGFDIPPGGLGENILSAGIDLFDLPRGTRLRLGGTAEVEVTGLRNPCIQMDRYMPGLMQACLPRAADGSVALRAGIMGIVLAGGTVAPGDPIETILPPPPHEALRRV